jgi:hypothetical protein
MSNVIIRITHSTEDGNDHEEDIRESLGIERLDDICRRWRQIKVNELVMLVCENDKT